MAEFALESSAFENAQPIPSRHRCEGEDVSPPLRWTNVPKRARSPALVVDEPDAPSGVFTHWVARGQLLGSPARRLTRGVRTRSNRRRFPPRRIGRMPDGLNRGEVATFRDVVEPVGRGCAALLREAEP